jgi:hypothetical protein
MPEPSPSAAPPLPPATLSSRERLALSKGDQARRWARGEHVWAEVYLEADPEVSADAEAVLDLICAEVLVRRARGEPAPLEEYLARFPDHADALHRLFDLVQGAACGTLSLPAAANGSRQSAGPDGLAPQTPGRPDVALGAATEAPGPGAPATRDLSPLPAVAGYEVLGLLGKGGMGVVYKARHLRLGRVVALKMILHADHADADERRRFKAEAEAVARLQHALVVQIFEVGEHQGSPYLSLEFCPEGSLADALDGTPWEAGRAAALVEALARAVQSAHAAGIVHRDLKPGNVLLAAGGAPKITDFGLAKKLDQAGQTRTGAVVGTPSYMAPEQARGEGKGVGPSADVYALGAILYECLTGRPPFKAASSMDTILQVLGDEPVPVRSLQPKVPRDLETVCLKCLRKQPAGRYPSAEALAEDLRRWRQGEPIAARPVGRAERLLKWVRRRPAAAGLLAALALLAGVVVAALVVVADRLDQTRAALGREQEATRRREQADRERQQAEVEQALARADALLNARPETVPAILDGLGPFRAEVVPRLREVLALPEPAGATAAARPLWQQHRTRAALALLPDDPGQLPLLRERLLDEKLDPDELLLIRGLLLPHREALTPWLWAEARGAGFSPAPRPARRKPTPRRKGGASGRWWRWRCSTRTARAGRPPAPGRLGRCWGRWRRTRCTWAPGPAPCGRCAPG